MRWRSPGIGVSADPDLFDGQFRSGIGNANAVVVELAQEYFGLRLVIAVLLSGQSDHFCERQFRFTSAAIAE